MAMPPRMQTAPRGERSVARRTAKAELAMTTWGRSVALLPNVFWLAKVFTFGAGARLQKVTRPALIGPEAPKPGDGNAPDAEPITKFLKPTFLKPPSFDRAVSLFVRCELSGVSTLWEGYRTFHIILWAVGLWFAFVDAKC